MKRPEDEVYKASGLFKARLRMALIVILVLCLSFAASAWWFFFHGGGDEAPPKDDDLRVTYVAVPEEENGFSLICEAAKAFRPPEEPADEDSEAVENDLELFQKMCEGVAWDPKLAERVLEENRRAFALLDEGLRKPRFQVPRIESLYQRMDYVPSIRNFARNARLNAFALLHAMQEKEALEAVLELVRLGRALQASNGAILHDYMGSEIKKMGLKVLREIVFRTTLSPALLVSYTAKLEEAAGSGEELVEVLKLEYQLFASSIDSIASGSMSLARALDRPEPRRIGARIDYAICSSKCLFKPNRTKRLGAEATRVLLRNLKTCEGEREKIRPGYFGNTGLQRTFTRNSTGNYLCEIFFSGVDRALTTKALAETDISATRLLIALKCWKLDTGSLPPSLETLVPKYIDAVPRDPFDGKAFRYSPEKKVIYSVGTDLEDAGGAEGEDGSSSESEPTYAIDF